MAKPKNFTKIDAVNFKIDNIEFRTELDYDNLNNVWVFCNDPHTFLGNYCVHFKIDWNMFKISMRKCILGEGDIGEDIFVGAPLDKVYYQTPDTFINLLSSFISKAHSANKFYTNKN